MFVRAVAARLPKLSRGYPIIAITGPRQAGKTTLARAAFPKKPYVSLEDPDQRAFAAEDPRGFLRGYPDGAVIDEVQRCPSLLSYLQTRVDEHKKMGEFVLTGSAEFSLLEGLSQSLAGRVALVQLLPFSYAELETAGHAPVELDRLLFQGLYPPLYDRPLETSAWYADYVQTYIERDVRTLTHIQDLHLFQKFVRLCAGRTGQLINYSDLGADCGISHNTARAWVGILEASFIVFLLQPHHKNFSKRLVKTPKLYFYDTGLACYLQGIQREEQLAHHPQRGALMETWVVSELSKYFYEQRQTPRLFFWRTNTGIELDILVEHGTDLVPVEIKAGETIAADYFKNLATWRELAKSVGPAYLVYGGGEARSQQNVTVVPWHKISALKALV